MLFQIQFVQTEPIKTTLPASLVVNSAVAPMTANVSAHSRSLASAECRSDKAAAPCSWRMVRLSCRVWVVPMVFMVLVNQEDHPPKQRSALSFHPADDKLPAVPFGIAAVKPGVNPGDHKQSPLKSFCDPAGMVCSIPVDAVNRTSWNGWTAGQTLAVPCVAKINILQWTPHRPSRVPEQPGR